MLPLDHQHPIIASSILAMEHGRHASGSRPTPSNSASRGRGLLHIDDTTKSPFRQALQPTSAKVHHRASIATSRGFSTQSVPLIVARFPRPPNLTYYHSRHEMHILTGSSLANLAYRAHILSACSIRVTRLGHSRMLKPASQPCHFWYTYHAGNPHANLQFHLILLSRSLDQQSLRSSNV